MSKRAVILAGGKGTRLKPYTIAIPKPLVPIGKTSILEIIIQQLVNKSFSHITITINHFAELIKAYIGDGTKWNVKIDYSQEYIPLKTMGPLQLIDNLPDDFLVMNGDILSDINYSDLYNFHVKNQNLFTISSFNRTHLIDYGELITDKDLLIGFREKPKLNIEVSMGVYIMNKEILKYIPKNKPYGFDDLMLDLLKYNIHVDVQKHHGKWLDIGRPKDYERAISEFDKNRNLYLK